MVWPMQSLCKEIRMGNLIGREICEMCGEATFVNRHTIFFKLNTYLRCFGRG